MQQLSPAVLSTGNCATAKLATANCQLATGNCQLATGNWQLATGNWQLPTTNWQLQTALKLFPIIHLAIAEVHVINRPGALEAKIKAYDFCPNNIVINRINQLIVKVNKAFAAF